MKNSNFTNAGLDKEFRTMINYRSNPINLMWDYIKPIYLYNMIPKVNIIWTSMGLEQSV